MPYYGSPTRIFSSLAESTPEQSNPGAELHYFILTGVHLLHVCVGMAVLTFLLTQTRRHELSGTRMAVNEGGACFGHLVDLLWILIFPLLYLVA